MDAPRKSPGAAFLLSIIPGAGHVYAGSTGPGVIWLAAVAFAYKAVPALGLFLHVICAARAAQAAAEANRREEAELASRQETAEDVARMLDSAVAQRTAAAPHSPPAAPVVSDPAPRVLRAAFPVPPGALVRALADAMTAEGLLVLGVDEGRGRVRASADAGGGRFAYLTGQVEATPAGSRVRLLVDRPPGSPEDADADDRALRSILQRTERLLPAGAGGAPVSAAMGASEALTEDHFLEQLREAWEAYEQGWMPEPEWRKRKAGLVSGVSLRPGTRPRDFLAACRPLSEAGVLDDADVRAIEARLG